MTTESLRPMPWWFSPRIVVLGVLLPIYVGMWLVTEILGVSISTAKGFVFLRGEAFLYGLAGLAALAYGTLMPLNLFEIRTPRRRGLVPPIGYLYGVGFAALFGYAYWFKDLIANPGLLIDAFRSGSAVSYSLRSGLERSAGLASLATLGLAFFILYSHRVWLVGLRPVPRALTVMALTLAALTLFRAFAWAERLAFVEVACVIVLFGIGHGTWIESRRRLTAAFPVIALAGGILFFGAGEYYRSWASHYSQIESSYWAFVLQRLLNYYYQALNTGAGMITVLDWPSWQFGNTLDWLHKFPVVLGPVFRYLTQIDNTQFLQRYGDPEFNNPSGLFGVLFDIGLAPSILLLAFTGLIAQSAFRAFRDRDNVFGIFYPVFFLTIIELFRYWYLGSSRAFLLVLALVFAALLARRTDERVDPFTAGSAPPDRGDMPLVSPR